MYRCFKMSIQNSDLIIGKSEQLARWKQQGENIKKTLESQVKEILHEVTNADGVIDGEKLSSTWFPISNKDVFLSYSHNDEELALTIVGILNDVFGLRVFIDSLVWGSADSLLKAIDNEYCKQSDGNYNYTKRNFSTSHVHAMLSTSIMRAMDQAEVIFFLNTANSNYKLKDGFSKEHTLSPWIYEEIMCATMLREKSWQMHRNERLEEAVHFEKSLNVAYPMKTDDIPNITFKTLGEWSKEWDKRQKNDLGRYGTLLLKDYEKIKHPLNVLYEMMFGVL